jgi:hypothetical protein
LISPGKQGVTAKELDRPIALDGSRVQTVHPATPAEIDPPGDVRIQPMHRASEIVPDDDHRERSQQDGEQRPPGFQPASR